MIPKEKAKELVERYELLLIQRSSPAKQCALIAIDEILTMRELSTLYSGYRLLSERQYYEQVKQEIKKL